HLPPAPTPFPYTTLFRSRCTARARSTRSRSGMSWIPRTSARDQSWRISMGARGYHSGSPRSTSSDGCDFRPGRSQRLVESRRVAAALGEVRAAPALAGEDRESVLEQLVHRRSGSFGAREAEVGAAVLHRAEERDRAALGDGPGEDPRERGALHLRHDGRSLGLADHLLGARPGKLALQLDRPLAARVRFLGDAAR